ncbi:hypothetical protein HDV00_005455 [Rhizophlyctis rosea]|nr:hypothetical protein HDV00_005455 [Rhizophlyctis rosea]
MLSVSNRIRDPADVVVTAVGPLNSGAMVDTTLQRHVNDSLLWLLTNGTSADVQLLLGPDETVIQAHRCARLYVLPSSVRAQLLPIDNSLILNLRCVFFEKALSGDWVEGKTNSIKLPTIQPKVMKCILEYIYGGALALVPIPHSTPIPHPTKHTNFHPPPPQSADFEERLDLFESLKYLSLEDACRIVETSLRTTLETLSQSPTLSTPLFTALQSRSHPELIEMGIPFLVQQVRKASNNNEMNGEMVSSIAKAIGSAELCARVMRGAWGVESYHYSFYEDREQAATCAFHALWFVQVWVGHHKEVGEGDYKVLMGAALSVCRFESGR